jgi:amino acid adenylation domain-containing protein
MEAALSGIAERHETLRTSFVVENGALVQRVHPHTLCNLLVIDLTALAEATRGIASHCAAQLQRSTPFVLSREPLFRAMMIRLTPLKHLFVIAVHHLVFDGASCRVFYRDLAAFYRLHAGGAGTELPLLKFQYADFSVWEQQPKVVEALMRDVDYWNLQLANAPEPVSLKLDRPRNSSGRNHGASLALSIPPSVARAAGAIGRAHRATLFMTLVAAFEALLHRYSRQNDILIGTPISRREKAGLNDLIGLFVNIVVLRVRFTPDMSFSDLLQQVQGTTKQAYAHQNAPFERVVESLRVRGQAQSPIVQAMFTLQMDPSSMILDLPGLTSKMRDVDTETVRYDLFLFLHHQGEALEGWIEYNADLFDRSRIEQFSNDFSALLDGAVQHPHTRVDELPLSTADLASAAEEQKGLASDALRSQLAWWREQLAGMPGVLELPTDFPRPALQSFRGATLSLDLESELTAQLQALCHREGVTLFMLLLAAFQLLLARYSGQQDIVVGSPIAGRTRAELEGLLGCFVNVLLLRTQLSADLTFRQLLARVRETCLDAYAHQDVPFEKLVEELQPVRDLSRQPLFQVMFVFQNTPAPQLALPNLQWEAHELPSPVAKVDLTLAIQARDAGLRVWLEYNADLFLPATMTAMFEIFPKLCRSIVHDPGARCRSLRLLEADEFKHAVACGRASRCEPPELCPAELFERHAAATPNAIAVTGPDGQLTYRELNEAANRLAHLLRSRGISREDRVALCLRRDTSHVVAILGVLKSGAAYVPIDPQHPFTRIRYVLEDSRPSLIIAHTDFRNSIPDSMCTCLWIDDLPPELALESTANLAPLAEPGNLAYVIYTSGSTGAPKGVMVTHANIVRLFSATEHWFSFSASDIWSLFHSFAFDYSVWELWGALLYGGRIVIVPYLVSRSPAEIRQLLESERVTIFSQTPSAFRHFLQGDPQACRAPASLRAVVFAGEALFPSMLRPWFDSNPSAGPELINMYGITETSVHSTFRLITPADAKGGSAIGEKIPDLDLFILDDDMQPTPVGMPGELYIGGPGVARGYFNRSSLTAQRFVPHPFATQPGERLYRSGDRVRRISDCDMQYLGRLDQQVKLRGFRIELGEIEAAIKECSSVNEAVALLDSADTANERLIAYLVPRESQFVDTDALRTALKTKLPEYMIPSTFVPIPSLPLTVNGKLDRSALPAPGPARRFGCVIPPATEHERLLAEIWKNLLDVEAVDRRDNFFELGGQSLLASRLVSAARNTFHVELRLRAVFECPTLETLAALIAGLPEENAAADPESMRDPIPAGSLEGALAMPLAENVDELSDEDLDRLYDALAESRN